MVASAVGFYGHSSERGTQKTRNPVKAILQRCVRPGKSLHGQQQNPVYVPSGCELESYSRELGGALGKMLLPFKMNAGGPIASGKQWMPWISMDDQIYSMHELLMDSTSSGAYNLTAPNPVSQREFAKTLGRVLNRLAIAPLPTFVVKILFGEMGMTLLTEGQHVIPSRLEEQGMSSLTVISKAHCAIP